MSMPDSNPISAVKLLNDSGQMESQSPLLKKHTLDMKIK